ncbi:hypothetical protein HVV67_12975 [Escherichia coli]|uniref:hypothetical protein n=1 Tax=Escherichia coli TaxID=562 RepID=UPI000BE816E3|nr:hypothetical protein [Escherichia coli]ELP2957254.1 hypothetical protein [Escherichia coli O168]EFH5593003.1 hypothetical protein [Escherichia coli]EFI3370936.1 hypothetical protein [Escherichia coli]EFM3360856.1 hypothetical protein [Escherichia coli]EFR9726154.1 hypothetical protein [Escherichia coli]
MASNWIKLEVITPDKPEIFRIAEILNIDPDAALGKVIRFWAWADQQMIDGNAECNARGVTKSAIDRITFMAGFADALIQVGWLVESDGVLSLPNFERHNGKSSKKRAVTNERVTKIRELKRKGNAASVTQTDQKALPEEEEEEDINTDLPLNPPRQKRASKKFEPEAIALPDWLPETLWNEWVQFRQALRKPIRTEQGANGAIRELEKFRQQGFTPEQVIRHSIANEYQGLFAPKSVRPETLLRQVNTVSFPDSAIPPGFRG